MSTVRANAWETSAGAQSVSHKAFAKAWLTYDNNGAATVNDSYNVSSVDDDATGNYSVNWTNAFSDADYSQSGVSGTSSTGALAGLFLVDTTTAPAAGDSGRWGTYRETDNAADDCNYQYHQAFGDLA